jgi:hypothetical protein
MRSSRRCADDCSPATDLFFLQSRLAPEQPHTQRGAQPPGTTQGRASLLTGGWWGYPTSGPRGLRGPFDSQGPRTPTPPITRTDKGTRLNVHQVPDVHTHPPQPASEPGQTPKATGVGSGMTAGTPFVSHPRPSTLPEVLPSARWPHRQGTLGSEGNPMAGQLVSLAATLTAREGL